MGAILVVASSMMELRTMFGGTGMKALIPIFVTAIFLVGCGDTMSDIKDAASGINSKANEAAAAISMDVHSIRATELTFDNESITINDLFKAILRDVQWQYDTNNSKSLKITGTWQDNGLFMHHDLETVDKNELQENGNVTILLFFNEGVLDESRTKATLALHGNTLANETGSQLLPHFYETYTK